MGHPSKTQRQCDIFLDSVTFKRLRDELESYEPPMMLVCEEEASHDPIHRRLVSALHTMRRDVIELSVPDGRFYREELARCCNITRETDPGIVLAYGLGIAATYACAISTCAWSESDPWQKYHFNVGAPAMWRIPFAHVFTSLEQFDDWGRVLAVPYVPKTEPDFAIQVTSAIY